MNFLYQIAVLSSVCLNDLKASDVILTDVENYKDERLMYVGLSRARFSLTVLETQKASDERGKLFFERMVKNVR